MLPFPNDFWLVDGRLALSDDTFPKSRPVLGSVPVRAEEGGWNDRDGFAVFPAVTTYDSLYNQSFAAHLFLLAAFRSKL